MAENSKQNPYETMQKILDKLNELAVQVNLIESNQNTFVSNVNISNAEAVTQFNNCKKEVQNISDEIAAKTKEVADLMRTLPLKPDLSKVNSYYEEKVKADMDKLVKEANKKLNIPYKAAWTWLFSGILLMVSVIFFYELFSRQTIIYS